MNDSDRGLEARLRHLLLKTHHPRRHVWLVGDSRDGTLDTCLWYAKNADVEVSVVVMDTGIDPKTPEERLLRASLTAEEGLRQARRDDEVWMIHESDLISSTDVIEQMLWHYEMGRKVVGGWPRLVLDGKRLFYDTWAYRRNGRMFSNDPPYHPEYVPGILTEMDSVGSCWIFPAEAIRKGLKVGKSGAVSMCRQLREMGYEVWMDPDIIVEQPTALWTSQVHAKVEE